MVVQAQMHIIAITDLMPLRKPGDALPCKSLFPAALPDVTRPWQTDCGWLR